MMLCTPYRCAQERKNIRRQLCNWSGKALGLVGLEEVLVAAYGKASREKLPFSELSGILSKAVDSVENDNNICGVCGKPKKAPIRKMAYSKLSYSSPSEVIDLTVISQPTGTVDQPIDLSKSSRLYSSPSALANDHSASLLRTPNGISSPIKAASAKRQRVGGIGQLSMQRDILQMGNNLDPSIVQLVNNWSKVQPPQHRSHSPTASPNNAYETFSFNNHDIPGPSNSAAVQPGLAANRAHHYNRTSAAATAGSLQRTTTANNASNNNNNNNSTGAHFTGEPSDISGSTLSDQDAVNRFKQWRVASWVQEATRHQREGSALTHNEDTIQDLHADPLSSRLPSRSNTTTNNNNTGGTNVSNLVSRSSPPPPLSNVLRNVPVSDNAAKLALRKRVAQQQQQPPAKQRHSTPPPHPVQTSNQKSSAPTGTGLDASSSKRVRSSDQQPHQQQPQQVSSSVTAAATSSAANNNNNNNASLNNLASVLSSLFPSTSSTTPASSSLLPGGVSPTDLDALLTLALQNWTGSPTTTNSTGAGNSNTAPQNDPTAALLTAAYQQQMQQAALLQLQYASIFSNPLLYSNLLLGGAATPGTGATAAANNLNFSSLTSALGASSNVNVDAVLAEALLAMLGSGSSTTPVQTSSLNTPATGAAPSSSGNNKQRSSQQPQEVQQQHHSSHHTHRHGNSATLNASTPHRPHATTSSATTTPNKPTSITTTTTTTTKPVVNAQQKQTVPETKGAHNVSSPEPVILNLDNKKQRLELNNNSSSKSKSSQLPVTPSNKNAAILSKIGAKSDSNGGEQPAAGSSSTNVVNEIVEDLSIRKQEVVLNGTHEPSEKHDEVDVAKQEEEEKEIIHECQNGEENVRESSINCEIPASKELRSVVVNGEGVKEEEEEEEIIDSNSHLLKNGKSSLSPESNHQDNSSRDSHSSAHLEEQSSRSPVLNGKASEIIDLQTTV